MAAAPSDMPGQVVTVLPGELVIDAPASRFGECTEGCIRAHSWTVDGRRVCWRNADFPTGRGLAVDAEQTHAPVPPSLAARWALPPARFWTAWTRAEVHAKLLDVPILAWLQGHGLDGPDHVGIQTWSGQVDDLTVTVGRRTGIEK